MKKLIPYTLVTALIGISAHAAEIPTSVAGLDIWLTDAGNTFDGTTWSDSSGNTNHATAVGQQATADSTNYPDVSYVAGSASNQFSIDGVAFSSGTDDLMTAGSGYNGDTDITVFMVFSTDTASSEVRPGGIGSQAAKGESTTGILNMATDGSLRYDNGNNTGTANPTDPLLMVRVMRLDSGSVTDWVNTGSGLTVNIGPTSTPSNGSIPNPLSSDANAFYFGDVRAGTTRVGGSDPDGTTTSAELFISQAAVYTRALTNQEVTDVADWMSTNPSAIPEPGTLLLVGISLGAVVLFRRKRG